jgi:peptide/nickel transport system substrate-binding protein
MNRSKKLMSIMSLAVTLILMLSTINVMAFAGFKAPEVTLKLGDNVLDTQMMNKNPFLQSGVWTRGRMLTYDALLYFNPIDGKVLPALADSYTWSKDYKTLTLKLNTKAKWQDGKDFTADDVVYTYECLIKYPVLDTYGLGKHISSITGNGETVTIKLNNPFVALPNYITTVYIVPKHLWDGKDPTTNLNENPIGTGPFIFTRYNTGTDIQYTANKNYFRGAPKVDKLIVQMYSSTPNLMLSLLKGEITGSFGAIAMPSVPEYMSKPGAKMQLYAGQQNACVFINNDKPFLNDINVRKAMNMVMNRADLMKKGEYNAVYPLSTSWLPDIYGDLVNSQAKFAARYDVAAANKVLTDAGYTKGKDGIYQKDGKKLSFTYYSASGAPAQQMEASMIQQWLSNLGIEIIPKLATWPELGKLLQSGNYDLLQNLVTLPPDPFASLNTCFNSSMTAPIGTDVPGLNYFRFKNKDIDALLNSAATITDHGKLKIALWNIQKKISEQYPFIPMYNVGGHVPYYTKDFTGFSTTAPIYDAPSIIKIQKK